MQKLELMQRALASMAGIGDIFTDAPECEASVAAAQNLTVLAGLLSSGDTVIAQGALVADNQVVSTADVRVNGKVVPTIPEGFDTSGRNWELVLAAGQKFSVAMFAGECADDETWVVDEPEAFYSALLQQAT
ncbi:hypothetical protein G3A43_08420 [Paraburkholderia aspalathi]|nr:hypothetical protein [Paraburkholderia aspalathi]MBK3780281.1 hypothetical protein [Paraburkholderia aspalathi]